MLIKDSVQNGTHKTSSFHILATNKDSSILFYGKIYLFLLQKNINLMKVLAKDKVKIISEPTAALRIDIEHDLNEMVKCNRETTLHICNCTRLRT